MTNAAFVGRVYLERGDLGSPVAYTRICQVTGISGLGQTNPLVEVTTFCSVAKEFVGGLAEGSEVTLTLNYETGSADIAAMIQDVKDKRTRAFRVVADSDGDGNANQTFYFDALCLSWVLNPSVSDKNAVNFSVKISGDVLVV